MWQIVIKVLSALLAVLLLQQTVHIGYFYNSLENHSEKTRLLEEKINAFHLYEEQSSFIKNVSVGWTKNITDTCFLDNIDKFNEKSLGNLKKKLRFESKHGHQKNLLRQKINNDFLTFRGYQPTTKRHQTSSITKKEDRIKHTALIVKKKFPNFEVFKNFLIGVLKRHLNTIGSILRFSGFHYLNDDTVEFVLKCIDNKLEYGHDCLESLSMTYSLKKILFITFHLVAMVFMKLNYDYKIRKFEKAFNLQVKAIENLFAPKKQKKREDFDRYNEDSDRQNRDGDPRQNEDGNSHNKDGRTPCKEGVSQNETDGLRQHSPESPEGVVVSTARQTQAGALVVGSS